MASMHDVKRGRYFKKELELIQIANKPKKVLKILKKYQKQ